MGLQVWSQTTDRSCQVGVLFLIMVGITLLTRDLNYLSKNLLKPLVELSDEVEPWHFNSDSSRVCYREFRWIQWSLGACKRGCIENHPAKESITRLQLAATTNTYEENQQPVTSEIRQRVRIVHGFSSLEGIFWCAMLTFWPSLQKHYRTKSSRKVSKSCDEGDGS